VLLDKRLLVITGKGGVGRTTVATALGLAATARGKRTIICEVAQQERMSHVFSREGIGYSETELAPNLHAMSVNPQHALEEYLVDQIGSERLAGMLARSRMFDYFVAAAPGVRELATIGKVWELAQPQRRNPDASPYDLVIVDAPASGHGVGLLKTPQTYREIARVGPIRRQAGYILEFLEDPDRTAVVAVALPQEMPVTETIEFSERLAAECSIDTQAVIVNAVLQARFTRQDAERIASLAARDGTPKVAGALRATLGEYRRARGQRTQLQRLRRHVDHVTTLPFVWEPELGLEELQRLAADLERKI